MRHLIREGLLEPEPYSRLTSLPTNKFKAWKVVTPLREEAAASQNVQGALRVFCTRLGLTLPELATLFKHEGWRSAKVGGNAWADITGAVNDLANALDSGDSMEASSLVERILEMRHNTGIVGEKLDLLDKLVES